MNVENRRRLRVGVDTGGTFTDFVILDESSGEIDVFKVPSTRSNQSDAIVSGLANYLAGIDELADAVVFFCHGTTVGTNAILEGSGARTGLVITDGFRGVYEVGEQARGQGSVIYDLFFEKPRQLVSPRYTEEVLERITATGEELIALDEDSAKRAIEHLVRHGAESVAVALLFSFKNPQHEQRIKEIFSELAPWIDVSVSSDIAPEIREYYRMSTTVVNAYLNPLLSRYINRLDVKLREIGVTSDQRYIIRSNGGVASFSSAAARSVQTILSGPAAGVVTAQHVAALGGIENLVTFDMGGTSTDVALIRQGEPVRRMGGKVHSLDVLVPMLDIHTVAAGGGTIAWVDDMGVLQVGPRSAGSEPGPACYGRGGVEPTVTDANLVLGVLSGSHPLAGGALKLDLELAKNSILEKVASPLGISVLEAARGIIEIVNVKMQEAIKVVSSNRGYDLRDFYLFAFGGAGPLHGCQIAEEMGMKGVIIPPYPGVTSALGLLLSDIRHDFVHSDLVDLSTLAPSGMKSIFDSLKSKGTELLQSEGFNMGQCHFELAMDLRYGGQGYELTVGLPELPVTSDDLASLRTRFDQAHLQYTGHFAPDEKVEVVNYRLAAIASVPSAPISVSVSQSGMVDQAEIGRAEIYVGRKWENVPVYQRSRLPVNGRIEGPALILQNDSTTYLTSGQTAVMNDRGYLILEMSH
ncbi:MAG: hydantoinase/oxoprolinase family protein [Actinobacteria bacterium]|jgi:N-methylhydantoinase A|nr:hydantoinase/oxoprolinase family protein [Actinomycetota bacterium]